MNFKSMNKKEMNHIEIEKSKDNRELVIEENTIYEIDFDCVACHEKLNMNQ